MSKLITKQMIDHDPTASLSRAYREMGPNQFLREVIQNAEEAGASQIRFIDVDGQLGCFDDGCGMSPDELLKLINGRNSSTKNREGVHANFGIGLKDSTLAGNHYGVVVVSRTEEYPQGAMIWMHIDSQGTAGAKLIISDEIRTKLKTEYEPEAAANFLVAHRESFYAVDFGKVSEFFDTSSYTVDGIDWMSLLENSHKNINFNTCIVLMGMTPDHETSSEYLRFSRRQGTPLREERLNNLASNFIGSRYYALRLKVGSKQVLQKSNQAFLKDHLIDLMNFNDFTIKVFLTPNLPSRIENVDKKTFFQRFGFISALLYKNELYDVVSPHSHRQIIHQARQWGLHFPEVYNRVKIIVEPPHYNEDTGIGCFPSSTRAGLFYADPRINYGPDKAVPLQEVKAAFIKNMPKEIRDLQAEAYEKQMEKSLDGSASAKYRKFFKVHKERPNLTKGDGSALVDLSKEGSLAELEELLGFRERKKVEPQPQPPNPVDDPQPNPNPKPKPKDNEAIEGGLFGEKRAKKKLKSELPSVIFVHPERNPDSQGLALLTSENGKLFPYAYTGASLAGSGNILYVNESSTMLDGYINAAEHNLKDKEPMSRQAILDEIVKPFIVEHLPASIEHARSNKELLQLGVDVTKPEHISVMLAGAWQQVSSSPSVYYKRYRTKIEALGDGNETT
jgi:hypothetical protein